ncbi:MAG: hypothetical protein ABIE74_01115 [Pseudomonadota bacterium]
MGFAEEMANLGEHLVSSFDNRIKDVKGIMADTHNLRRDIRSGNNDLFEQTHNVLKDARAFVRNARNDHKDMAQGQRENLAKFVKDLSNDTVQMLKAFAKGHREMSKKQHHSLETFVNNMCDECDTFLRQCNKEQIKTHNEFKTAHQNFQRAMKELEKHRAAVNFPSYDESKGGGRIKAIPKKKTSPEEASAKQKPSPKKKQAKERSRRRVSK